MTAYLISTCHILVHNNSALTWFHLVQMTNTAFVTMTTGLVLGHDEKGSSDSTLQLSNFCTIQYVATCKISQIFLNGELQQISTLFQVPST